MRGYSSLIWQLFQDLILASALVLTFTSGIYQIIQHTEKTVTHHKKTRFAQSHQLWLIANSNQDDALYNNDSEANNPETLEIYAMEHNASKHGGEPQNLSNDNNKLLMISQGKQVDFSSMPEPVLVMFGNHAFRYMLGNFICNMQMFPPTLQHTLFIVSDKSTLDYLESFKTEAVIWLIPSNGLEEDYDYETANYKHLMLLRGESLVQLLGQKRVLWLEPDAMYFQNPLLQPEIAGSTADGVDPNDLFLYWDHVMYGGGFIVFPANETSKVFYADIMNQMRHSGGDQPTINDQQLLNTYIKENNIKFKTLDDCRYRSGFYYRSPEYQEKCKDVRPVVQQHNWIVGLGTKEEFAKSHNAWFLSDNGAQCAQRDLRLVVMTMNRAQSLRRLIDSLQDAKYPSSLPQMTVDLQITVDIDNDGGIDPDTKAYLDTLTTWDHGFLEIKVWPKHMGLLGQWIDAWPCEEYPPELYKAVIFLEDDLEVSPYYFEWFLDAHRVYGSQIPNIGAITGQRPALVAAHSASSMDQLIPIGMHAFAYKLMATWSLSPKYEVWKQFRSWFREKQPDFVPSVEGIIPWEWYQSFVSQGRTDRMWEMWYIKFTDEFNYYTVYPWVQEGKETIVANWMERGLNYQGQENQKKTDYPLFSMSVRNHSSLLTKQCPLPYVEWDVIFQSSALFPCEAQ